jgi:hypothetical protein
MLSPLLGNDSIHIAMLVLVLSSIHIVFTFQSLRFVSLKSLNRSRLHLLLQEYLKLSTQDDDSSIHNHNHMSPATISQLESIWPFSSLSNEDSNDWLKLGCPLSEICPDGMEQLKFLRSLVGEDEKYLISCSLNHDTQGVLIGVKYVQLTFLEHATFVDVLRGMTHAHALRVNTKVLKHMDPTHHTWCDESEIIITQSYKVMKNHFDKLMLTLSTHGWNMEGGQCRMIEGVSALRLRINQ